MNRFLILLMIVSSAVFYSCNEVDPCEEDPQACFLEQYEMDIALIEEYIIDNDLDPFKNDAGLYFKANNPGIDDSVSSRQFVSVDYVGRLLDGTIFDTSVDSVARAEGIFNENRTYKPLEFQLGVGRVIAGWDLGLLNFEKGGSGYLIIPSYLAYGNNGAGSIPPNSVLYFEINLIDVRY